MLEIEENLRTPKYFLGSGLMRNIYTRYHICYMRIKSRRVSLERWFDVKYLSSAVLPHTTCIPGTCHSPKYRYVIVTVVYLVYCITAVCVSWFCDHRAYISDAAWMLGVLEIEESLFFGSSLMRNIYTRYHICLMRVKSRRVSLNRWFDVKYSSCRHVCLVFRIESYLGTSLR